MVNFVMRIRSFIVYLFAMCFEVIVIAFLLLFIITIIIVAAIIVIVSYLHVLVFCHRMLHFLSSHVIHLALYLHAVR